MQGFDSLKLTGQYHWADLARQDKHLYATANWHSAHATTPNNGSRLPQ